MLLFNTSKQASTKEVPYELAFGRAARSIDLVRMGLRTTPFTKNNRGDLSTKLYDRLQDADVNLTKAQAREKKYYDMRVYSTVYLKGDWVYLKSTPKSCSTKGITKKLSAKWTGPYEVTNVRGVNLTIRLPRGESCVHHNRAKLAFMHRGSRTTASTPPFDPQYQHQDTAELPDLDEAVVQEEETEDGVEDDNQQEQLEPQEEEDVPQQGLTTTRSGRVVRPPPRFKDYVMNFE